MNTGTHWPTSNAEFLAGIFGTLPPNLRGFVNGFGGHPDGGTWAGWPHVPAIPPDAPSLNWYFTLAVYWPPQAGEYKRKGRYCATVHGVMLDDIGTKVDAARLQGLPPSVLIETSPGNHQAIYLFPEPVGDLSAVNALQASIIEAGLCEPGAHGPTARWSRMPFAVNGKRSPPWPCRLVEWHPARRFTIAEIRAGLVLPEPAQHVAPTARPSAEWDGITEVQQADLVEDLRSALQVIPSDDRGEWVRTGHCLAGSLPSNVAYDLWAEWSATSAKCDDDALEQFWTFDPDQAGHRGVFAQAIGLGWKNPRRSDPARVFAGASVSQPLPTASKPPAGRRYQVIPGLPLDTARALLQRDYSHPDGECLKAWQGVFHRWDGAGWLEMTTDDVRAMLYRFLERDGLSSYSPTQTKVTNLLDALKAAAHLDSKRAPPSWVDGRQGPPPRELLACRNGLLHLPARVLYPPTPAFFSMNAAPYSYSADAPTPMHWLAFLRQLWPDDPESIATLQEVFGYLLTPDTSQQKLFLIVGPKRSGKGTIGRVLARLLGDNNVTSPSLSSLGAEFGLQPLMGKLAAIVSDARLGGRADPKAIAENLLRLSGEDRVEVNRKHLSSITLQLTARFVMLTNELPRLADSSGAMASRFVVLKMNQSFYGKEDPGLTGRLLEELPGVLNWAIEGWQRLHQRGHFVTPRSSMAEAQELADLGSPVLAFVRDACELAPLAEADVDALYQAWKIWCTEQGIDRTGTKEGFGSDLRHAVDGVTRKQRGRDAGRAGYYRGIGLRHDWHGLARVAMHCAVGVPRAA